ncbi:MAG: CBS domain-containing protein [Candidatus Methanomethylophilaceae archaeon]|jgi:IMP dehydrogenase|nr:CBS domain-containing protein [Candidatus Methanomethylophilaceae archaeon]
MAKKTVGEIMIKDVRYVGPSMTVEQVRQELLNSNFHGFPIVENGYLLGFVTAKDLLKYIDQSNEMIRKVMTMKSFTASPGMALSDATRLMFRYGLRNLPVVDENRKIVGIVSNIDIVRSQIEAGKEHKVASVKTFLEKQSGMSMKMLEDQNIPVDQIIPTQKEVYNDELQGRQYELKRGLNESLIMIKRRNGYLLVDGHHRAMAAKLLGYKTVKAIVLVPSDLDYKLGLESTASKWGLRTLNDVKIIDNEMHPFMEEATLLLPSEMAETINKRLLDMMDGNDPKKLDD